MPIFSNTPNHFLKRLSPHDQDLLRPHLRPAEFPQGLVLYAPHDEIARVYLAMIYAHTQQIVACNAVHRLEERLCRWLLQTRDLIMSETLPLTQEFLAQMLGVQRSSVTLIARRLQESGLITYRWGTIQVLDVEALRDSSCECYAAINAHFERLVGWRPDF
jgi:hypothetical protein